MFLCREESELLEINAELAELFEKPVVQRPVVLRGRNIPFFVLGKNVLFFSRKYGTWQQLAKKVPPREEWMNE